MQELSKHLQKLLILKMATARFAKKEETQYAAQPLPES
jgi:hypothetical protein